MRFTFDNYKNSISLVNNKLHDHQIPISSINKSKEGNLKEVHKEVLNIINNTKSEWDRCLRLLNEEPSLVSEIINAGWIYHWRETSADFGQLKNFPKEYKIYLGNLDDILLKSIEISLIHSFYNKK
jgi:hypothetical protein